MPVFYTNDFYLIDPTDDTKRAVFDCSTGTTGTQVVYKISTGGYIVTVGSIGATNAIMFDDGTGGFFSDTAANRGIPQVIVTTNQTAVSGALGPSNLIASITTAGFYRVSWVATITQAATTSSVLGGTNGFQIQFTDDNDSVVKTSNPDVPAPLSSANTTATTISGVLCARCKASTALKYLMDYTSVGGTAMNYDLYIKAEFLG